MRRSRAAYRGLARHLANGPLLAELHSLRDCGDLDAAVNLYHEALAVRPEQSDAVVGEALVLELWGELQRASELLAPYWESDEDPVATITLARVKGKLGSGIESIALLEQLQRDVRLGRRERRLFHFTLAGLLEHAKRYDDAFRHFELGNALKRANFRPDDHSRRIDDIIAACSAQRMRAIPASAVGSRTPVFVIGLPRSGTTLVEQILAAHPDVVAAGELQDIPALAYGLPSTLHSNTPFPWCMDELQQDAVNTLSQWYLARLRVHSATAARITDKLPYNFLYLGLITKLFPDAAIIHCVRDPFDTAISCYTTDFIGIQDQAYRLEDLAYYHNEYARLMRHWRSCLEDHTVIPGFGTISNEAQQALEKIAERANES